MSQAHRPDKTWSPVALDAFMASKGDNLHTDDTNGKIGRNFGQGLDGVDLNRLSNSKVTRSEVFLLVSDRTCNTLTIGAAAMAWGGMNQRYRKKFFAMAQDGWLDVAEQIRAGQHDRRSAYAAFAALRETGKLYGVGPAYFTKIIYFLMPRSPETQNHAYIMDQWAGCSINLLASRELVKMDVTREWRKNEPEPDYTYRVSDANTDDQYENFCKAADALRVCSGLSHDEVDRQMIATGGKDKSSWRKFVIENRRYEHSKRNRS